MPPRGVTVGLQAGIERAELPDGFLLTEGHTRVISWDDWQKMSATARANIVTSTFITIPTAVGVDLTANSTTLPTGRKLGETREGIQEPDLFKLVKLVGANSAVAGTPLVWSDPDAHEVMVPTDTGTDEIQVVTLASFDTAADSFKLTFDGQTTAFIVRGTNATAAGVQAALQALSNIGSGNATVAGTTDAGPYTVTFTGELGNTDVPVMTVVGGAGGVTGTVATTVPGVSGTDTEFAGIALGTLTATRFGWIMVDGLFDNPGAKVTGTPTAGAAVRVNPNATGQLSTPLGGEEGVGVLTAAASAGAAPVSLRRSNLRRPHQGLFVRS